jgi:hypothetical protein
MRSRLKSALGWLGVSILSIVITVAMVAGWGLIAHGSVYALPALAQGQEVFAQPASITLGDLEVGRRYQVTFTLTNLRSEAVMVNGMRTDCTCVSANDWPLEIPPRGRHQIQLWVQPKKFQAGQPLSQTADLYLSVPGPPISITMLGTVARMNPVAMTP